MTPPASMKGAPLRAIFDRASSVVRASISPRSSSSLRIASKSTSALASAVRVTKRTKSSHNDEMESGASCCLLSASPASRKTSRRPIMVDAFDMRIVPISAWMAAASRVTMGSSSAAA